MMSPCDGVAERVACGEPLAELASHADDCPRCQSLLAAQSLLATGVGHAGRSVEPARGFTARMTVVASQRLVTRHRRRVVGYASLSATAAAMLTFALVREPSRPAPQAVAEPQDPVAAEALPAIAAPKQQDLAGAKDPWLTPDEVAAIGEQGDHDARALLVLARSHAAPVSADWDKIERPLRPYRQLLLEVGMALPPDDGATRDVELPDDDDDEGER